MYNFDMSNISRVASASFSLSPHPTAAARRRRNKPTVSIAGLDVVHDTDSHAARRLIWSLSLMSCLILVIVHGASLVQRYRTYPTRVQLDVSNRQGIALPAVTVCPLDRFDLNRLQRLWRRRIDDDDGRNGTGADTTAATTTTTTPDATEKYYQLADVMPVQELWQEIAYSDVETLFPMCYIGRGRDCQSAGTFQPVWTPSGTCFTYSSKVDTLNGHFNGLYARLTVSHELDEFNTFSGWKVTVHPAEASPWLTSSRAYSEMTTHYQQHRAGIISSPAGGINAGTVKSQYMNIRLAPKEFVRIDQPRQPCRSEPNGDNGGGPDCEIECFQRAVTSVTNCRLPYMNLTPAGIPYCNSSASVRRTEELVARLITETRSQLKCNCIEPCSKVVYKYESESHSALTDYGRLKIFYETALWVTVNEVLVYSPVKLLCDAGNILCLLLGASVLSFVETADYIAHKLMMLASSSRLRSFGPSSAAAIEMK